MKLTAQASRATDAASVVTNAANFSQTQNDFLTQVSTSLSRMSELAVDAQDTTKSASDISGFVSEFTTLQSFVSDIGNKLFNGINLFGNTGLSTPVDGDTSNKFTLIPVDYTNAAITVGLALAYNPNSVTIGSVNAAATAASILTTAIQTIGMMTARVGANIERLNLTSSALSSLATNLNNASGAITATDIPTESANFSKQTLLVQAGSQMLAQAENLPNLAISLLSSLPRNS